jgi:hypothetical protein
VVLLPHKGALLIVIQAEEMKAQFDVDSTMFFNKAVSGDGFAATELRTGDSHKYFEQFYQKTCPDILRAMESFTIGGLAGMSIFPYTMTTTDRLTAAVAKKGGEDIRRLKGDIRTLLAEALGMLFLLDWTPT